MCVCMYVCVYVCTCMIYVERTCMYVCVYVCTCMYVCVYVCTCMSFVERTCAYMLRPNYSAQRSSRCKHEITVFMYVCHSAYSSSRLLVTRLLVILRPIFILLHKGANTRAPPCNDLEFLFFIKKFTSQENTYIRIYVCVCVCVCACVRA